MRKARSESDFQRLASGELRNSHAEPPDSAVSAGRGKPRAHAHSHDWDMFAALNGTLVARPSAARRTMPSLQDQARPRISTLHCFHGGRNLQSIAGRGVEQCFRNNHRVRCLQSTALGVLVCCTCMWGSMSVRTLTQDSLGDSGIASPFSSVCRTLCCHQLVVHEKTESAVRPYVAHRSIGCCLEGAMCSFLMAAPRYEGATLLALFTAAHAALILAHVGQPELCNLEPYLMQGLVWQMRAGTGGEAARALQYPCTLTNGGSGVAAARRPGRRGGARAAGPLYPV